MKKRLPRPHPVLRALRLVIGILLLVLGIIGILIPAMPQIPFLVGGLILLATEFRPARKLLVWLRTRLRLRRLRRRTRKKKEGADAA